MFFDQDKLEQLLVAHWTEFLDTRQLLRYAADQLKRDNPSDPPPNSLTISQFKPISSGFLVWLECAGKTIEIVLTPRGDVRLVQIF